MVSDRRRSSLRWAVQEELIKYFCTGVTARAASEVSGVNRNTAILFYHKLRKVIFEDLATEVPELLAGEVEVDENYFGDHRKGKRGRGPAGKVPVLGQSGNARSASHHLLNLRAWRSIRLRMGPCEIRYLFVGYAGENLLRAKVDHLMACGKPLPAFRDGSPGTPKCCPTG